MNDFGIAQIEENPFVSVIVPAFNEAQCISTCIEALLDQTYPRKRYEILIVDNASTDATRKIVQSYPVTLLIEDRIRSSYAARNKGLRHASGGVIAFTDSDCTPVPTWIEEGVRILRVQSADLVAGNVRFIYSHHPSGAEIWDSLTNMQIERNVRERSVAKTANLFARAAVFDEIGPFPVQLRSGGDVIWVSRAVRRGFKLVYAPAAEVAHPARQLGPLLRKQYRVGKGQPEIWREDEISRRSRVRQVARLLLPPSPLRIRATLLRELDSPGAPNVSEVWLAAWLAAVATALGNMVASLHPPGK